MAQHKNKSNQSTKAQSKTKQGTSSKGGQTMADIGRKGGLAPHRCRGFQCQKLEQEASSSRSRTK